MWVTLLFVVCKCIKKSSPPPPVPCTFMQGGWSALKRTLLSLCDRLHSGLCAGMGKAICPGGGGNRRISIEIKCLSKK